MLLFFVVGGGVGVGALCSALVCDFALLVLVVCQVWCWLLPVVLALVLMPIEYAFPVVR